MNEILKMSNITKRYTERVAVKNINLKIHRGDIYALIGHNGAGKTTLMKIITSIIEPTSGNIKYLSQKNSHHTTVNNRIGALVEEPGLMTNLTGFDNLKVKALCMGIQSNTVIYELLTVVGLQNDAAVKVKRYSLGMKQRLGIAMALVGNPEILILDEPINGLDPEGILFVRELIKKINKEQNVTIIISSHILTELYKVATKYAFLKNGELVANMSYHQIKKMCDTNKQTIDEYYFEIMGGKNYD